MTNKIAKVLGDNVSDETEKAEGMPKYRRIILEDNDAIPPTGLYIGLNGTGYYLRAGEPADVPQGVINILKDAVMSQPVVDPASQQIIGYRDRMRFPFRYVEQEVSA